MQRLIVGGYAVAVHGTNRQGNQPVGQFARDDAYSLVPPRVFLFG